MLIPGSPSDASIYCELLVAYQTSRAVPGWTVASEWLFDLRDSGTFHYIYCSQVGEAEGLKDKEESVRLPLLAAISRRWTAQYFLVVLVCGIAISGLGWRRLGGCFAGIGLALLRNMGVQSHDTCRGADFRFGGSPATG